MGTYIFECIRGSKVIFSDVDVMLIVLEVRLGVLIVGVKVQVLSTSPGCRNRLPEL